MTANDSVVLGAVAIDWALLVIFSAIALATGQWGYIVGNLVVTVPATCFAIGWFARGWIG